MKSIKGTPAAVHSAAAIRDRDAGCPHVYSILLAGEWRNVCPACHEPIAPPWTCSSCGWEHADGVPQNARFQMGLRVADVVVDDAGVASTEVSDAFAEKVKKAKLKPPKKTEVEEILSAVEVEEET